MQRCAVCGHESAAEFRFCPNCGAAAGAADDEHRKVVTVLFCDVAGSTALGESIDPETLRELLARYFERMKQIVERHGGTVEKFIGDAVMAVFGVPAVHEDDALRALRAAAEMRDAFANLDVTGRIGVNSGEVITGTAERLATGDAVNVAARLEQAAPPGEILVGEPTLRLVADAAELEPVEPLVLKGKQEPVPAWRLVSVSFDARVRVPKAPLFGREPELGALETAWARVRADRSCELVTVVGAAGVGKSRLVTEFLERAGESTTLRARCLSYGEGITYWPVVEIVTQLRDRLEVLDLDATAKAALGSLLARRSGIPTDEIAWAFRKLVEALAAEAPVITVFDDIQWGEEVFLDLLEHVAVMAVHSPVLLCCMARPELLERRPGWGGVVRLQPLDATEAAALASWSLGGEVEPDLRERIVAAAGGNPLFVEEMAAMVAEAGAEDVALPPTIQALLAARLDQLSVAERGVLESASIEGEIFHRGSVQALAPKESQLATRLTALVQKELVQPDRAQLPGDDAFRFRHLLIRDAAYDSLPRRKRSTLHERFADWLKERGADLVEVDEIVGYHLEQAYRLRQELGTTDESLAMRAGLRLAAAGETAFLRGDLPAAVSLLGRARELLPMNHPQSFRVVPELATAMGELARRDDALRLLSDGIEHARRVGDELIEWRCRTARLWLLINADDPPMDEIADQAERAIEVLSRFGDHRGLATAWRVRSDVANARGDGAVWVEGVIRAADHALRANDLHEHRTCSFLVGGSMFFGPTPVSQARARLDELLETASGNPLAEAGLLRGVAACDAQEGRFAEARDLLGRVRDTLGDRGGAMVAGHPFITSRVELLAGDPVAAEREAAPGIELLRRAGFSSRAGGLSQILARALLEQGRLGEALEAVEAYVNPADRSTFSGQSIRGAVLARRGDVEKAVTQVRHALALAGETDFLNDRGDTELDAAEVFERAGESEEALAAARRAVELFDRKENIVMAVRARARLDQLAADSQPR